MRFLKIIGMKHSGSTMCMNIFKYLYTELGYDADNGIGKDHSPSFMDPYDTRYIMTVRDIRDAAISNFFRFYFPKDHDDAPRVVDIYGVGPFMRSMIGNIELYECGLNRLPIVFSYEEFKMDPVRCLRFVFFNVLGSVIEETIIHLVLKKVERDFEKPDLCKNLKIYHTMKNQYGKAELLMRDHNTSDGKMKKYKTFFSKTQHQYILQNRIIKSWLQENGYCDCGFQGQKCDST